MIPSLNWPRFFFPLTEKRISDTIKSFENFQKKPVLIHSSLSQCGQILGGVPALLKIFRQIFSRELLIMPAHSYCYPDKTGIAPVFDAAKTPSVIGKIADSFWRQPEVVRSIHPTHSLAAYGPEAAQLCRKHEDCDTPCGPGTPYEKLLERDTSVLMFGVTMNAYTLFHTAEDAARVPYLYEKKPYDLSYRDQSGEIKKMKMKRHDMSIKRCFIEMGDWFFAQKLLKKQKLGKGMLLFVPSAAALHLRLLEELKKNPLFLVHKNSHQAAMSLSS